ncbi:class I mannose-6-phosphate isomerase [Mucilaginibacter sp. BJC16-A38]|uniref:type I phosphomannose isomerase catalytic subunit n=1 Tax=Mucilaginibacter phenanthrenivorans TaxID=1234842 RepID=UPI00215890E8|nr:type I phosphomannose isomerase catalytic subunit [Mucilaginibacter phenanthrenivorans]MCR8558389.1 class I mannose-6-phosphate isomerase [Mucilaginibacter phenanthrenivorans]
MENIQLYPLKFDPIYQYRIWGGRRLNSLLEKPLPKNDPIGEAWILSDRDDHPSKVINGKLKGKTIKELFENAPKQLLGKLQGKFDRFPLLLKFLDCQQVLSVQVHPSDDLKKYIPKGENGKTEAWVVLETGKDATIYAGLKSGTTKQKIEADLKKNEVAADLASFKPKVGDSVLIEAGTVHTLGDVVVFEVQENSDVTYRLYDWDRIDEKTGKPRDLQVNEALACIDFDKVEIKPITTIVKSNEPVLRETLIENQHFNLCRVTGEYPFMVGKEAMPRVLVCIDGEGEVEYGNEFYHLTKGEVMLLPANAGACPFVPKGEVVILELSLPEEVHG